MDQESNKKILELSLQKPSFNFWQILFFPFFAALKVLYLFLTRSVTCFFAILYFEATWEFGLLSFTFFNALWLYFMDFVLNLRLPPIVAMI